MKRIRISGGILEAELASSWSAPQDLRCERCPEIERAAAAADRLRALLACALDFVPPDHPLILEAVRELE